MSAVLQLSAQQLHWTSAGQQFSTRVDVLSKEFVAELEKLQVGHSAELEHC
jgi:predicted unusual protein kinase regulating ubiquinone biosynthesis (AarF/ABC1/UbiB family)